MTERRRRELSTPAPASAPAGGAAPKSTGGATNMYGVYHGHELQGNTIIIDFQPKHDDGSLGERVKVTHSKDKATSAEGAAKYLADYFKPGISTMQLKNVSTQNGVLNSRYGFDKGSLSGEHETKMNAHVQLDMYFDKDRGEYTSVKLFKPEPTRAVPVIGDISAEYRAKMVEQVPAIETMVENLKAEIAKSETALEAMAGNADMENSIKAKIIPQQAALAQYENIVAALKEMGNDTVVDEGQTFPKEAEDHFADAIALMAAGYGTDGMSPKSQEVGVRVVNKNTGEVHYAQMKQKYAENDPNAGWQTVGPLNAYELSDKAAAIISSGQKRKSADAALYNDILLSFRGGEEAKFDFASGDFVVEIIPVNELQLGQNLDFNDKKRAKGKEIPFQARHAHYENAYAVYPVVADCQLETATYARKSNGELTGETVTRVDQFFTNNTNQRWLAGRPLNLSAGALPTPYSDATGLTETLVQRAVQNGVPYDHSDATKEKFIAENPEFGATRAPQEQEPQIDEPDFEAEATPPDADAENGPAPF